MILLNQPRRSNTCGHHCVAMITGYTVGHVAGIIGHGSGTGTKEIAAALNKLGYECSGKSVRIKSIEDELPDLCMLTIHFKTAKHTHWVVYNKGEIFDPGYQFTYGYYGIFWGQLQQRATSYLEIKKATK